MSLVAGCSLFSSVMLAADTRATVTRPGGKRLHIDNLLKLYPLTPGLSRLSESRRQAPVGFMVASVVRGRPNVIERSKVAELMNRFCVGQLSMQRNWLPRILLTILSTPAQAKWVALSGVPQNLLYALRSPGFEPEVVHPLGYAALGSGEGVVSEIGSMADWVFAGQVGNISMEAHAFQRALMAFVDKAGIESVGRVFPMLRIDADGIRRIGHSISDPTSGIAIEVLAPPEKRWVLRNTGTGKEMELRFPTDIDFATLSESDVFSEKTIYDALRDAIGKTQGTGPGSEGSP